MTASEAALYDDNTLRKMDAVDRHNLFVGESGFSPYNLVFGEGSTSVQFEELPDSPQEHQSPERDDSPARTSTGTASSSDGPPPKRLAPP